MFNLFASLADFERELIRERTQAGLSAARSRGRWPSEGLPAQAEATAMAAQTLYREGRLSVSAIEPYGMNPLEWDNYALSIPYRNDEALD